MAGCASTLKKQYYMLNYIPDSLRAKTDAFPCTIRVKEFDVEEVYDRSQFVYRVSHYQLNYDWYRVWAVKPSRMITDQVYNHLDKSNLASHVIRRYNEGSPPDYELSGTIHAIEEYDSEDTWFAHLALTITLRRTSDGRLLYTRNFDRHQQVFEHETTRVVKAMSTVLEIIMNQVMHDLESTLQKEFKGL
jgi:uncharacterized lipoprotein YmbA